jgi:hypothetical protein
LSKKTDTGKFELEAEAPGKSTGDAKHRRAPKPYLEKDFGTELNFKLWITKGSRFIANRRLIARHKWSIYTVGVLSVYVIILGMADGFQLNIGISSDISTFATTAMTVIILIFSQLELSKEYSVKAREFHLCGLEIAELYNELRWVKTNEAIKDKTKKVKDISDRYSAVLRRYENHDDIDRLVFHTTYPEYFGLKRRIIAMIWFRYYSKTYASYHIAAATPIVVYFAYLYSL